MSELKKFQTNLDCDKEAKNMFVNKERDDVSDDESISDDEEEVVQEHIKIMAPRKSKKGSAIDAMLFEQTIAQQKAYLKAQKTIYRLQSEIDTEEVKTRYLKLELNNLEVKLSEEVSKNKIMSSVQIENIVLRAVIVLYTLWSALSRFM
jgi:hypothetical protein